MSRKIGWTAAACGLAVPHARHVVRASELRFWCEGIPQLRVGDKVLSSRTGHEGTLIEIYTDDRGFLMAGIRHESGSTCGAILNELVPVTP